MYIFFKTTGLEIIKYNTTLLIFTIKISNNANRKTRLQLIARVLGFN